MSKLTKWWRVKPIGLNKVRTRFGIAYLIIGVILFFLNPCKLNIIEWLKVHFKYLIWLSSWAFIGIGASLINSRGNRKKANKAIEESIFHYIFYFFFVMIIIVLASFTSSCENNVLKYPLSALIALSLGFVADKIGDLISFK